MKTNIKPYLEGRPVDDATGYLSIHLKPQNRILEEISCKIDWIALRPGVNFIKIYHLFVGNVCHFLCTIKRELQNLICNSLFPLLPGWGSNPNSSDPESDVLPLHHRAMFKRSAKLTFLYGCSVSV